MTTPLPAAGHGAPVVSSGVVKLYEHDNWSSRSLSLATGDYRSGYRHFINGTPLQDKATWVAFNLPVGTVMTLIDNTQSTPSGGFYWDLRDCGRTCDLVGTGRTVTVDLTKCGFNDKASGFFWRVVDLDMGAVEMWEHIHFSGVKQTLFLSEWPEGEVHAINKWFMQDRMSSIRWASLDARSWVVFHDNADGSGKRYANVAGWVSQKELADANHVGFNDKASAWTWHGLAPKKEVIAPLNIEATGSKNSHAYTSRRSGTNDSSTPLAVKLTINEENATTVTVSTTDTFTTGMKLTASTTASYGTDLTGKVSATLSVELSMSYTHTATQTRSDTNKIGISISDTITVPPFSTYTATALVQIGEIEPTSFETTARRWYDEELPGTTQDPDNNNWWVRDEVFHGTIAGGIASQVIHHIKADPIASP